MARQGERRPIDQSKLEYAANLPTWIDDLDSPNYSQEVVEVIKYFLAHSPCADVSARRVSLTSCGWPKDTPSRDSLFMRSMLAEAHLVLGESYFTCGKREEELDLFSNAGMGSDFYETSATNRVALVSSGNPAMDLFKAIRNSLAHFRFCLVSKPDTLYLAMENGVPGKNGFEVKARLFLSIKTLQTWIELIHDGKARMKAEEEREYARQKELEERLLLAIDAGEVKKEGDIAPLLNLKKAEAKRILVKLKKGGLVEYVPQKRRWERLY